MLPDNISEVSVTLRKEMDGLNLVLKVTDNDRNQTISAHYFDPIVMALAISDHPLDFPFEIAKRNLFDFIDKEEQTLLCLQNSPE